ncbi:hypothetical protein TrST_g9636 [Triparma strigata]|uniref:CSD domain-containing protein n=1 Tax=Triparma strigata TaxID=1606541 RepID=A0A9W6ZX14_9STRA|nr:hypothetical protein TrST_g9636 [Triparma strigata]
MQHANTTSNTTSNSNYNLNSNNSSSNNLPPNHSKNRTSTPAPSPPPSKNSLSLPNPIALGRLTRKILTSPIYLEGFSPVPPPYLPPTPPSSPSKPTILIIGSTGSLGLTVVRRLNLSNSYKLKVLVRDIYSQTVDNLGYTVSYSYGDVRDVEAMGVGVTDVDKVVYVAAGVEKDETDVGGGRGEGEMEGTVTFWNGGRGFGFIRGEGMERIYVHWRSLERTTGDGKRELKKGDRVAFKLGSREKFSNNTLYNLVTNGGRYNTPSGWRDVEVATKIRRIPSRVDASKSVNYVGLNNVLRSLQDVRYVDYDESPKRTLFRFKKPKRVSDVNKWTVESVNGNVPAQWWNWKQNNALNGVWKGKGFKGFKVRLLSGRLSTREAGVGVDFSGFGGFTIKMMGDGKDYECIVREGGEEYSSKVTTVVNPSTGRGKFTNVVIGFDTFKSESGAPLPQKNITQVGFSYDGGGEFYLSLSYMKLYRKEKRQTPEFLFVSDGRLPVEVKGEMVNDGLEQIEEEGSSELFDEEEEGKSVRERKRERYWKWKGEESLKSSGVPFSVIRVLGYEEESQYTRSKLKLQKHNKNLTKVTRLDVADAVLKSLGDERACNKVLYLTRGEGGREVADDILEGVDDQED